MSGRLDAEQSNILLLVQRDANRQQLADWLAKQFTVEANPAGPVDEALGRCDLCIVDDPSLRRYREELRAGREAAAPVFLPLLLVLTGSTRGTAGDPWEVADGVIEAPIRQAELQGRIDVLLRARRYSLALKRRNDRLEQFAGIVTHDLRNPLTIAQGYLDAAQTGGEEADFDRVARALDRIEAIIDDVLSLARLGTGVDSPATIGIRDAVETAWENVDSRDAKLEVDIDADATLDGDESQLVQLFENLFRNAIEHGDTRRWEKSQPDPADGSTAGETGPRSDSGTTGNPITVRVGLLEGNRGFFVEDDGVGVPSEDREQVFEYGFTTHVDGTGFGLAIVESIVATHDWSIRLTVGTDGGARFEITTASVRASPPPTHDHTTDAR